MADTSGLQLRRFDGQVALINSAPVTGVDRNAVKKLFCERRTKPLVRTTVRVAVAVVRGNGISESARR